MEALRVQCLECERGWNAPSGLSVYEQQALESCPCPFCGACVLAVVPEKGERRPALAEREF